MTYSSKTRTNGRVLEITTIVRKDDAMSFEEWLDLLIDKEIAKNPGLKRLFAEHPEKRELYKQKLIDSESGENDGFHLRYIEETKASKKHL